MTATLEARSASVTPPRAARLTDWRVLFAGLCVIWGFSFLLIKLGTDGFAPFQVSFGRMLFGALVLGGAMLIRRQPLPRKPRTWGHLFVAALILNTVPYSLFGYAELRVPSTIAGICNATTPLWAMVIGLIALREDRPGPRRATGLVIGFIGVLTVLGAWQGFAAHDLLGTVLALIAAASYAIGWAYVRTFLKDSGEPALTVSATQLMLGAGQLAVILPFTTSLPGHFSPVALAAVAVLGAVGTGLAYLMQFRLVAEVGATAGQTITYFIPVIAAFAGVVLLDERLSWTTPVGAVIILVGAALMQIKPKPVSPAGRG